MTAVSRTILASLTVVVLSAWISPSLAADAPDAKDVKAVLANGEIQDAKRRSRTMFTSPIRRTSRSPDFAE